MGNWRKSTFSDANGGQCVETADGPGAVLLRDTKDGGRGPVLAVSPAAWLRLTTALR
ncbi:MAG: DUF397 domain-containing protein [Streptosporangiales bacterium]|nr:DUF397 domain-containing protein [Streptosporangiales bacterium]